MGTTYQPQRLLRGHIITSIEKTKLSRLSLLTYELVVFIYMKVVTVKKSSLLNAGCRICLTRMLLKMLS